MNSIEIAAEELRQFIYCKRVMYFRRIYKLRQKKSYSMDRGEEYHNKKHDYRLKVKDEIKMIDNKYFYDQELGLKAIPDLIKLFTDHLIVVEFKRYLGGKPSKSHIMQSMVGGVLAEKHYNLLFTAVEVHGYQGRHHKIIVNHENRDEMYAEIDNLRKMLYTEILPEPTPEKRKCDNCEFYSICLRI